MQKKLIMDEAQLDEYRAITEAVLFASDTPLSLKELSRIMDDVGEELIGRCIDELNERYEKGAHGFEIRLVASGYQFSSRTAYAKWIRRLYRGRIPSRLTQAALECLSIVAYKQPISRTEVEAIRGVNVDGVLRTLLDRNLIRIAGRGEGVGRPILYATTGDFLKYFGLNQLSDLPKLDELNELLKDQDIVLTEEEEVPDQALFPSPGRTVPETDDTVVSTDETE
jgi:segregation and condensation protein B